MAKFSYLDTGLMKEHRALSRLYFRKSLFWHFIFFCTFAFWNYFFPTQPLVLQQAIQIDMVALPDFTKGQLQDIDMSAPVKEDVKPAPPVDVPAPTPDLMTLQKEEKKKEKPKKEESKDDSKTKESAKTALERLKKDLAKKEKAEQKRLIDEKKKDLERFDEKFRPRLAGNKTSQGNSATGAEGAVINAYLGHLTDKIRSNWELPPYLQSSDLRASVRLYIDAQGNARYFFSKKSGNEVFDNLVKDAIERAKPFAPPPEEFAGELKSKGMEVLFPL